MNWNKLIRQGHRWLSLIFTVTVIANVIAVATGQTMEWLYMLPLPPLLVMMITGLYMFFLPYVRKTQGQRPKPSEV
ncbi:hypothetical protein G5V57_11590 [Nordella sp. HKS 07]|uniref:hypothetical protein n=1 Tax=Nordella sp. HKS 07 TaxID=2712222 RepID=UPI0013E0F72E|nr:hypothetical protein [Nordella sp. HKS 07]QIG48310.1 hypothetical protein G5V57_11590 [Nordella sp. HKS 07]